MAQEQPEREQTPQGAGPLGSIVGGDTHPEAGAGLSETVERASAKAGDVSENSAGSAEGSGIVPPSEEQAASDRTEAGPAKSGTEDGEQAGRAPEQYADFTLPEGVTMDEAQTSEFKSFAKEQDLTQEQAQKVLEFGAAKIKDLTEAPYKAWSDMQTKWQAECKADPDIGGTKFEQSIKDAALVFTPGESNPFVGSADEAKALREALSATGAGNNPAIVRLFVQMGRLLAEPGPLTGKPAATDKQGDLLAKMYPTMSESP
ncbi:MAG TPA: hypothetical protein VEF34_06230 [Syntrophobacteraceae bacterium]|nr:hypothetical protein [Syntrophobacteraceae bacterium]